MADKDSIHIYCDESIHERGEFTLGAFVCGRNADRVVSEALVRVGLRPGIDEFKSSARMDRDESQAALRDELKAAIADYRIAIIVSPHAPRSLFAVSALKGLRKIMSANELSRFKPNVFFDEGMLASDSEAAERLRERPAGCDLRLEQDSRIVKGLQLADLVAHSASIMLLEQLGLVTKTVRAGEDSGYEADLEIALGFELWASLRYQFFHGAIRGGLPKTAAEPFDVSVNVEDYGLYIADECAPELRSAALSRFGTCYLGCIH